MALKLVVDAVAARLAAQWTACPVVGINIQGRAPKDGSLYVVVQYPVASSDVISTGTPGANVHRETGVIRFVVNAERGDGVSAGLTIADDLASLFRSKVFGGVRTFAPSSPVIDDRNDDGNYFVLSFAVPYEADIFG